ncbi:trifunctional purine biosynthetic protein adenosine-3-like isoform X1 [Mizuhopecten yessoensis]|uniref:trifunctional purine biosynthetic protein adenosine-3-like isoform X1 n=1 Tax=Mizuhopecten yessoensis TaxID=6573 RepID=UPI000B45A909|nr:trifunctional purine biosynthetic protein adenosine-3-like isoform X1 [Mizuhopecten yessoensis]XP_021367895.1 trifunctional purine biosynthetic protein adenosine-3-like isoform X1 [Mizuhopecten yessoensis]
METVLVIGSGGREHALSWKLAQSSSVKQVFVSPGNAGTSKNGKIDNVGINVKDFDTVAKFCKEESVSLVVVGPEDPLANGITDRLTEAGIPCFGPSAAASQIEASKYFSKQFMYRYGIPTARYQSFTDVESASQHIQQSTYPALVVKASGLAAGKGVIVADSTERACQAVGEILQMRSSTVFTLMAVEQEKKFGAAGETILVEELLEGEEVSCLAFTDGTTVAMMPPAQDHKALNEGDMGPNTGGMGVVCPYPKVSKIELAKIKTNILQKAVDGMRERGTPYKGVLYAGIMLTSEGPKVLEFNCRFGDPEAQAILSLMTSDLFDTCLACTNSSLSEHCPVFDGQSCVTGIVVASGGYPGSYRKRLTITGLDRAESHGLTVFHAGTAREEDRVVTNGGRVLVVMATSHNFRTACNLATRGAALVKFDAAYFRRDIGTKVYSSCSPEELGLTYKDSGVDITAGNCLVEAIKPLAAITSRAGSTVKLGGFGALFDVKEAGYTDPLLVAGTDGVGTKLKVAQETGCHTTIGIDLVAMCVNDILAQGAEPLFFLDYFATGRLNVSSAKDVVAGIAKGCVEAGCALIGGETAEMPGMYQEGNYDVAGFAVGAVERTSVLPRLNEISSGDVLIGLKSSGIHSNGFSLVRKVIENLGISLDMPSPFVSGRTLGEELLTPTKIYVRDVLPLMQVGLVKAFAHITGGGLTENIPRVLPNDLCVTIDALKWHIPPMFGWIADKGNVSEKEMAKTFNCGVGAVLIVDKTQVDTVVERLGDQASVIGCVQECKGDVRVKIENLKKSFKQSWKPVTAPRICMKVGVLISGSGTNLQALIDHTLEQNNNSCAEIVLVISNKPGVQGLEKAQLAGIPTQVINHKDFGSRQSFDEAVHKSLVTAGVDIVCLAGFMRILTGDFVRKWNGCMLNIHPSLLPSFKGHDAHHQVLKADVRISGCTVHFVAEEIDSGAILVQESVPVYPEDTEATLSARIKVVEHLAFPRALELVASGQARLGEEGRIVWCQ